METIFIRSIISFREHNATRFSAAIAYYMIFCMAPLFIFVLSMLGILLNDPSTSVTFFHALGQLFEQETVRFLQENLQPRSFEAGVWVTFGGLLFALLGASAAFKELKCGLDTIFEVKIPPGNFLDIVMKNLVIFGTVVVIGLFLLVSLLSTMAISITASFFHEQVELNTGLIEILNFCFSFGVLTAFFMIIYTFVPDTKTPFHLSLLGSVVTALLFTLGKTLFGIYLGTLGVSSGYGAAGSILALLLWIFISAQIFFFGAAITAEIKKDRQILKKIL